MKKRTKILIVLNLIIFILSVVSVVLTAVNNCCINNVSANVKHINNGNGRVTLLLENKEVNIEFRKACVKVIDSYKVTDRKEQMQVVIFVKNYLKNKGITVTRTNTSLFGELRFHNLIKNFGIKQKESKDADLDYDKDKRIFVRVPSEVMGYMGL